MVKLKGAQTVQEERWMMEWREWKAWTAWMGWMEWRDKWMRRALLHLKEWTKNNLLKTEWT